jgi:hypothetical protein
MILVRAAKDIDPRDAGAAPPRVELRVNEELRRETSMTKTKSAAAAKAAAKPVKVDIVTLRKLAAAETHHPSQKQANEVLSRTHPAKAVLRTGVRTDLL